MQSGNFKQIDVHLQKNYTVIVGKDITDKLKEFIDLKQTVAVTDSNVYALYGKLIKEILTEPGNLFSFKAGEESKNYKTLHSIYDFLIDKKADRYTYLLAFGGGVVGDVGAYAASTYMRGIPLIHIPTSLLAMTDSSIGGKTAINYGGFKNIVGCFYQPELVLCDIRFLNTLNRREFNSALAEVVKYGIIRDESLFSFMETNKEKIKNRDEDTLIELVLKSIQNKVDIVEEDEKEKGNRALLNFGHTLAHAIESATEYKKYLHGEAVSIGEVFAANLSFKLGLTQKDTLNRIIDILSFFELPVSLKDNIEADLLYQIIEKDKKDRSGRLRVILTKGIGSSIISEDLNKAQITGAIDEIKEK